MANVCVNVTVTGGTKIMGVSMKAFLYVVDIELADGINQNSLLHRVAPSILLKKWMNKNNLSKWTLTSDSRSYF